MTSEKDEKILNVKIDAEKYKIYKLLADYQDVSLQVLTSTLVNNFIDKNIDIVNELQKIQEDKEIKF